VHTIAQNARWTSTVISRLADIPGWFYDVCHNYRPWLFPCVSVLLLLFLIPLKDTRPYSAQAEYDFAWELFEQGRLADSQREAEEGFKHFRISNPEWSVEFQLLEAEDMMWRGLYDDALLILTGYHSDSNHPEETIRELAIEASSLAHQQQFIAANQRLTHAENLCKISNYTSCGTVLRTRGILAVRQGQIGAARHFFLECLQFAQAHHDRLLETSALNNMGWAALQINRYDEAMDWSRSAYRAAVDLGAKDKAQIALGNLGWAYYQLGDDEKALEEFLEAEKTAASLGDIRYELKWISTAGYIYHDADDLIRATQSYRQALYLARQLGSKEDIINTLEDLAEVSVETGKLEDASAYLDQVTPMELAGGNRLSPNVSLTQGMLAAARHEDRQAESLFRAVQTDPTSPTTTRLNAGHELARLFERQGNAQAAERMYKTTLTTFESARTELKKEESRLPFLANATRIYDDYIHLLVKEGRSEEALAAADQSRARTLAQGLGMEAGTTHLHPAALNPRQIARKTGATLLFYWLGARQSYLWTITPAKTELVELPSRDELIARVERYRKALLDAQDPQEACNEDGQALYKLLVAPAAKFIRRDTPVMILADGALNQLNFETLLVPGPGSEASQGSSSGPALHYLLEDATLLSAPSLATLSAAKPARNAEKSLLMLGNPVSPSEDYPSLPLFGYEMTRIERHFAARRVAVFSGAQANPAAYLSSDPAQYSYIHFVAHAVASRTDPLDSAIILSRGKTSEDSFKLYARDIMQHPIDARLVTISACYGSGTRFYAGEGLVGLSWAFLRAGAHNVIGALWEVSDDSTPRLMDAFYQGLEGGQPPAVALRLAKLDLLHSQSRFRAPFYWAPFQIYTRE
jgi:CHAT domain-containing protein